MPFGLFGKLPQKRDFLSVNLPTAILNPFETWLQSAVAASRSEIGRAWDNYYLVAPIWRFWLGKDILGTAITGALMPSVDQVGRYFPLAIIYYAGPGETLQPPLVNPLDDWYAELDARLLSVLAENAQGDPGVLLGGLRPPDYSAPPPLPPAYAARPQPAPDEAPAPGPGPEPEVSAASARARDDAAPARAMPPADAPADQTETDTATGAAADDDGWSPEPMAADRLAELDRIAAASSAPPSVWEPVDSNGDMAAAPPAPAAVATASAAAGLWDDLPDAKPPEPAPREPPPPATSPDAAPASGKMAVLGGAVEGQGGSGSPQAATDAEDAGTAGAPDADMTPPGATASGPAREPEERTAEPAPAAAEAVAPEPPAVPVEVTGTEFKGGLVATLANAGSVGDALPQLMALDIAHTARTRGYWWCGPSSSGGPRLYAKSGLPDPYFYSRMLMWPGA